MSVVNSNNYLKKLVDGEEQHFSPLVNYNTIVMPDGTRWDGGESVGIPAGGAAGQVLAKSSDADYDITWTDPPSGGESVGIPAGGTAGQTLVKQSDANGDAVWQTLTAEDVGARSADWLPNSQDMQDMGALRTEQILSAATYAVGATLYFNKTPDGYDYLMGRFNYTGIVPSYGSGSETRHYTLTSFTMSDSNFSIYIARLSGAQSGTTFTLNSVKRVSLNLSTAVLKVQDMEEMNIGPLYGVE